MISASLILLAALILDWVFGEPKILWGRVPHPVVLFGKGIELFDRRLNKADETDRQIFRRGAVAITILVLAAGMLSHVLSLLFSKLGVLGIALECFLVFALLAQRSLFDHVNDVAVALRENGLEAAHKKLGLIVGRDPTVLRESGVSRASIETLAENFSDGVVAPAFWYLIFGLPGIFIYKMINTADSMIGYKNKKYLYFGRVAAQLDDLVNWVPARLSMLLIISATAFLHGIPSAKRALMTAATQAGLHRSPNAGWPEAAMAGGLDIALGGPRIYPDQIVAQAYINGTGKRALSAPDITAALNVFRTACHGLWIGVALVWILNLA